ncbi:MAG: hypothetical protein ACYTBV_02275 [Planctomycetota bacterium]|jgi:hypothetical protein
MRNTTIITALIILGTVHGGLIWAEEFNLQFHIAVGNDIAAITPDTFYAAGATDSNVTADFDKNDLLKPPPPPGSFVQIYSDDIGTDLIKDTRPFEPNIPDVAFPIKLSAYDVNAVGLTGTCRLNLFNPEALITIPDDTVVYLRRYDANGLPVKSYNLLDPNSHSIQWQLTDVNDIFAELDVVIEAKCLAANIDGLDLVTFVDFSILAKQWSLSGPELAGDINGDNVVDNRDTTIFTEKWLSECSP